MTSKTPSKIIGIQFSILSPEEIEKYSVAEITNKETYTGIKPKIGGLFDPRMGVLEDGMFCPTDGLDHIHTPGYFGHIELARPVFYIQYLDTVLNIAQCICIRCSKLLIDKGAHNLEVAEIACDGRDLRVALKVEVDLPFQLPFLNLRSVTLISSATTYNQRNNGLYLFGFRVS
jgi:DNA-directed RNA polymerase beta' subunit